MSGLLERDPYSRIGASSWSSLADHPFFGPLDFRLLEIKSCSPVFQPSQDKSNFDAVYELEELLLEQAPLEGRARKAAKKQHQQHSGHPPVSDGSDLRRSKKELKRKGRSDEEDKEEEILEMINQFFEPYDYTRYFSFLIETDIRHENNPQSLATLTSEIRRLSTTNAVSPGSTPPAASHPPDTVSSQRSTGHESSRSIPPMPPIPNSHRSGTSPSPNSDSDRGYPRYPSPPPQQSTYPLSSSSQPSYPLAIRPPPAVARLAGKEKKRSNSSSPTSSSPSGGGSFLPPPTSHPTSPPKDLKVGIMSWGKKDKDTRSAEKWESGVIGRERARVIIDVGGKRWYPT